MTRNSLAAQKRLFETRFGHSGQRSICRAIRRLGAFFPSISITQRQEKCPPSPTASRCAQASIVYGIRRRLGNQNPTPRNSRGRSAKQQHARWTVAVTVGERHQCHRPWESARNADLARMKRLVVAGAEVSRSS